MTAAELVSQLEAIGAIITVEGDDLVIEGLFPADAAPVVDLLRAPIIAHLTGRRLFAVDDRGRGCIRDDGVHYPRERLPANVRLLAVEGGTEWDRISRYAAESYPHLFADPQKVKNRAARVSSAALFE